MGCAGEGKEKVFSFFGFFLFSCLQVIAWTTPAYLLMANAGNAGFTGSVKGLTALFFIVVLISIFVSFWIGYSTVFFDSRASTNWAAAQIAAIVFITLDFVVCWHC